MSRSPIVRLVAFSTRFSWGVISTAIALAVYCAIYSAAHFSIVTDVRQLFPANLPWTERSNQFTAAFPQYQMLVVVNAPTAELSERASVALASALRGDHTHIRAVEEPQSGTFFARSGFLFLPPDQLARTMAGLERGAPLIGALAGDRSLRGVLNALSESAMGLAKQPNGLNSLARPMSAGADTVSDVLAGRPAHFSWRALAGPAPSPRDLRRFIEIAPILQFNALQPGRAATQAVVSTAQKLNLAETYQAHIQVTGLAPMNDAQFAALKENATLNAAISISAVLIILWLALRSWRIIVAVLISVSCGLAYSAALGLFLVGALNLISVAFFVLFVGLAVDFGIQFSVRYRAERHESGDRDTALIHAAQKAGWPLALAGAATALGFSAFLPTDYRGLSELGLIAGPGMILAFLTSVTLLPALLHVFNPPGEPHAMGFAWLAPVDNFLQRHRWPVILGTAAIICLASPLLTLLRFDFNTLHLENVNSPAVSAFLQLRKDPATAANAVEFIAPSLGAARQEAKRIAAMPQVAETRTVANFIPDDQEQKLAMIRQAATALAPVLRPGPMRPAPSDAENVSALQTTAALLTQLSTQGGAGGNAAKRLSGLLTRLSKADPAARTRATDAMIVPLTISLEDLRQALTARRVTLASIPDDLKRDWLTPDGHARVQILPKGDPDDTTVVRNFVRAALAREPNATGPAVLLYEAGNTTVRAFIEAGLFALGAIALLLWIALRRIVDVLMTLIPLLMAALLTLELCVVLNIPLNFTNIIAFPLLLGVGVAFKIYYIMAWRRGRTALVQSTLTRAVVFSAMTTATAFGSLWISHHPGTSSMGQLMSLALVCTMLAAVLFQPALMGPPRKVRRDTPATAPALAREQTLSIAAMEGADGRHA